jgi:vacuolar protein sorting-associated protein 13A/C
LLGVFNGATGIIVEPIMGGVREGPKGVAKGFGRGIIGIVAKPIAGTVGFVQCTVQGSVNTPGTIKKAFTKNTAEESK